MAAASPFQQKAVERVYPGYQFYEWCSKCGKSTRHIFGWYKGAYLTCLDCKPEAEKEIECTTS